MRLQRTAAPRWYPPWISALRLVVALGALVLTTWAITVPSDQDAGTAPHVVALSLGVLMVALSIDAGRRAGRGWYAVAACIASMYIGTAILWSDPAPPLVGPADLFLVGRALLAATAVVMLVNTWVTGVTRMVVLNAAALGTAVASVAAAVAVQSVSVAGMTPAAAAILVGYPVLDILVLALALGVILAAGARATRALVVGTSGIVVYTIVDVSYVMNTNGDPHSFTTSNLLGWSVAFAVVSLGGHASPPPSHDRPARHSVGAHIGLPLVSVALSLGVLVIAPSALATTLACASIVVSTVRTVLAFHEVAKLNAENAAAHFEMRRQAVTDALTGLLNRRGLTEALDEAVTDGKPTSLLLMDLDGFKSINDELGHACGDDLLVIFSDRLAKAMPAGAVTARLGGDEFAVLLNHMDLDQAEQTARAAHSLLVRNTVLLNRVVTPGVSIGAATIERNGAAELLRRADVAMYAAKRAKSDVRRYSDDLESTENARLDLVGDLRVALDSGQLELHYQPKLSMDGTRLTGVEALLRWHHPQRGWVAPNDFIPAAEATSLIHPLTEFVMNTAVRQAADWNRRGTPTPVAVNVSGRSLSSEDIVDLIKAALDRNSLPASLLEVEITETAIMEDPDRARQVLQQVSALGVTISLDDFGAGYTSLSQLRQLPLDTLKVDRSLVQYAAQDGDRAVVLSGVINLGADLGLAVVAEGVEDQTTLSMLAESRCDAVQGFVHSRAVPAAELDVCLAEHGLLPTSPAAAGEALGAAARL